MRSFCIAVWTACLFALAGCADLKQILYAQGQAELAGLRTMFGIPEPGLTVIQQFNLAIKQRDYAAALVAARREIAQPAKKSRRHLAQIRMMGIQATWLLSGSGLTRAMDDDALTWSEQALTLARDDEPLLANVQNYVCKYFSSTNRPGRAIEFAQRSIGIWERRKNPYQMFLGYSNLASLYSMMGDAPSRDDAIKKAEELSEKIFDLKHFCKPKGARDDDEEWLAYWSFLEDRMLELKPGPGSVARAFRLFARWERLTQKRITPTYPIYITFAGKLVELGQVEPALYYLKRGERTAVTEVSSRIATESSLVCPRIVLNLGLGRLAEAEQDLQRCERMEPSEPKKIAYQRYAGLLYEAAGNLDRAITAFEASTARCEQMRLSFSLDKRAPFFNNSCRLSLLGLVRTLSRRFLATQLQSDFVAALQAAEQARGRQFGELLKDRQGRSLPSLDLKTLQEALAPDEALLNYVLTDDNLILFAITRERFSLTMHPYDPRQAGLLSRQAVLGLSKPGSLSASKEIPASLSALSNLWLSPAQPVISDKARVGVLLDGDMYRIPFDVLLLGGRPLIEQKAVRIVPSLRYLLWARSEQPKQMGKGLMAVADPAFTPITQSLGITEDVTARVRGGQWGRSLPPLPETRTEVEAIAVLFSGEPVRMLLGADARESSLKRLDLHSYRYLHFATHGLGRDEMLRLEEPALVLSGEPGQDGILRASEASDLKLQAELTVLSACETGTGEIYPVEGVMGLSRSFLLAGSLSVLVSLWPVDSKSTAVFMVDFYRYLRTGATPESALRSAKLALLHGEIAGQREQFGAAGQTAEPYYWAPFVLVSP
ncbi:CHAT domain-containing protein [Haliangium sp. UPWRP_2]|uniref:CHAT domain-containing protein n=1 Tax=Haliangium sp. UPWRP_2 TaxID=1931276 RepID=UPI000B53ABD5|nr:CHAT domain-containing protein [Haliangium sp. UPWRP_2]PSM32184.1 CHAT domain-containing protein [Haliangium sp. UPWRP_2]